VRNVTSGGRPRLWLAARSGARGARAGLALGTRNLAPQLLDVVLDDLQLALAGRLLGGEAADLGLEVAEALVERPHALLCRLRRRLLDARELPLDCIDVVLRRRVTLQLYEEHEGNRGGGQREDRDRPDDVGAHAELPVEPRDPGAKPLDPLGRVERLGAGRLGRGGPRGRGGRAGGRGLR